MRACVVSISISNKSEGVGLDCLYDQKTKIGLNLGLKDIIMCLYDIILCLVFLVQVFMTQKKQ